MAYYVIVIYTFITQLLCYTHKPEVCHLNPFLRLIYSPACSDQYLRALQYHVTVYNSLKLQHFCCQAVMQTHRSIILFRKLSISKVQKIPGHSKMCGSFFWFPSIVILLNILTDIKRNWECSKSTQAIGVQILQTCVFAKDRWQSCKKLNSLDILGQNGCNLDNRGWLSSVSCSLHFYRSSLHLRSSSNSLWSFIISVCYGCSFSMNL